MTIPDTAAAVPLDASKKKHPLGGRASLLDVLMPDDDQDFEFEPPRAQVVARAADLD